MARQSCSFRDCIGPTTIDITHHSFPNPEKDLNRFQEWVKICENKQFDSMSAARIYAGYKVCNRHFNKKDYGRNRRLLRTAVPDPQLPFPTLREFLKKFKASTSEVPQIIEQRTKGVLETPQKTTFPDPTPGQFRLGLDEIAAEIHQTSSAVLQQVAVPPLILPEAIEVPQITEQRTMGLLETLQDTTFPDSVVDPFRSGLDEMDQTSSVVLQQVTVSTFLPEALDVPKISEQSTTQPLESRPESPDAVAHELRQLSFLQQLEMTGRQLFEAEQFDKICRLCFSNLEIKSFFKLQFQGLLLFKIFQAITFLPIREEDSLPKHICMICIEKIVDTFIFVKSCQESDKLLRSKIENSKIKVEPVVKEEEEYDIWEFDIPSIESQSNVNSPLIQDVQSTEQQFSDTVVNQNSELLKLENKTDHPKTKPNLKFSKIHKFVERLPKLTGPQFTCNICSESFDTLSKFKHHYNSKCQPLIYPCPICNKRCVSKNKIKLHMRNHTKERPYKCHICNEKFRYQQNFIRHNKRHIEEKSFACNIYKKRSRRSTSKIYHMKRQAGELPFLCTHCRKAFATSRGLQLHTMNHKLENGEQIRPIQKLLKKFACSKCPKKYVTRRLLFVHEQSHNKNHTLQKQIC